ncbi:MAG TPA: lysylphosphatidylglycerol synthase domain-containing protein [Puia sp.]
MRLNKNIKIILNYFIGPLVFLLLSCFIWWQVIHQRDWRGSLDKIGRAMTGSQQWRLWLVVALMPLNWGIEARKWQLALRRVGGISYCNAFKAIFTGATMASFTPNRIGEYLGRILYVKEGKRLASISLTIVCSIAQLLITLAVGMAGIFYMRYTLHQQGAPGKPYLEFWLNSLLCVAFLLLLSLTIIYFRLSWVLRILRKIPRSGKFLAYIKVLENFDATILLRILFLSFARYVVFIVQYGLIFPLFGVILSLGQIGGGVSVVFLVMALIPTFTFLTELGLRWEASIQALELFSTNTVGIFAASFAIWLINLIIPALIGSLLILSIKLFKNK